MNNVEAMGKKVIPLVNELFKNKGRNSKLNGSWIVLSKDKGS